MSDSRSSSSRSSKSLRHRLAREIPALQDLRSLIRREHGNGTDRLIRICDDLFEQNLEMGKHAISRRGIEEVGAVLEIEPQSVGNFGRKEGQVEL